MIYLPTAIAYLCLIFSASLGFFFAQNSDFDGERQRDKVIPARRELRSDPKLEEIKSLLIIDNNSGTVLLEKNATSTLPIASITKLMTALVFLDADLDWDSVAKIEQADARPGGLVYLLPGDEIKVKDLFNLMLVASTNEAAAALARISGFDDFVLRMNKKAKSLGMNQTSFSDFTGLDPANVSSVPDLFLLVRTAMLYPEIARASVQENYEFIKLNDQSAVKAKGTNQLLTGPLNQDDFKIVGGKTGYLDEAGYNLVFIQKHKNNRSLTLAILGAKTDEQRWLSAQSLVDWVFEEYQWPDR